jgi:hypothetical protein
MTQNAQEAEHKIWTWLDKVVIGEEFCPFAKVPRQRNQIKLSLCNDTNIPEILSKLANECRYLDNNASTETTLLALTNGLKGFDDYLDVLDLAQQLLEELGYQGVYQLASFHPQYLFEGEPLNSVSHYTNRAPLPMFHLIREASITEALKFIDDPESIPQRNIEHAHTLGLAFFKTFL